MRIHRMAVLACALGTLLACTDNRESLTTSYLRERLASESTGALALASMAQTNGYNFERDGMKLYTLEWEATVQIAADGWKAGWRDYTVLSDPPGALQAAVEGVSVKRLLKGGTAALQGKSTLQKADRGWRVLDSTVTASKIIPPPDQPAEGRSSDLQAFYSAFKEAVQSGDKQRVAKFVHFPFRTVGRTITEPEFHAQFPLSANDIKLIVQAGSPTSRENASYFLQIGNAGIDFQRDRDGYWKWSSIYYWGD